MNENQNVDDVSIEEVKNLLFSKKTIDLLSALRNKGISIDPDDILRANK